MTEFDYNNSTKVLEECVKLIKSSNRDEMTKLFFDNSFNISLNLANKDFDQELMNDLVNKYYPDLESNDDKAEVLLENITDNINININREIMTELKNTKIREKDIDKLNAIRNNLPDNMCDLFANINEESSDYECYLIVFEVFSKLDITSIKDKEIDDYEFFSKSFKEVILTYWAFSFSDSSHEINSDEENYVNLSRELRGFLEPLKLYLLDQSKDNFKELFNYLFNNIHKVLELINLNNLKMREFFSDFTGTLDNLNNVLSDYVDKKMPESNILKSSN